MNSSQPLKPLDGYDTHVLGDEIEKKHHELWVDIKNGSKEKFEREMARNYGDETDFEWGDELENYRIENNSEDIEERMGDIITDIKKKNRRSKGKEYLTYVCLVILIAIVVYFLFG